MFTDAEGFAYVHPMKSKSQAGEALQKVTMDVGIPICIISDGDKEETAKNTEFHKGLICCHIEIAPQNLTHLGKTKLKIL